MVYLKLAYLALIASLCEVSVGQCVRRVPPAGSPPPRAVPRLPPPPPPAPCDPCVNNSAHSNYERTLEQLISKLVNALIYTVLQNGGTGTGGAGSCGGGSGSGGGGGGGSGSGGGGTGSGGGGLLDSLLKLDLALGGKSILEVGVLGSKSKGNSSRGDSLLDLGLEIGGKPLLDVDLLGSKSSGSNGGGSNVESGSGDTDLLNLKAFLAGILLADLSVL